MKLKLIKDYEIVVDKLEYNYLKRSVDIIEQIWCNVRNKTALYEVLDLKDMYVVIVLCSKGYIVIKRFDTDDPEYNRVCAEELCELLNQKQ